MSTTNKAQVTRQIHFRSTGGGYDAVWMSDKGDLYQEYEQVGTAVTYYPNLSSTNKRVMNLTVTSVKGTGTVSPASVDYYANNTKLTFDTSGACTNTGWGGIFKKNTSGMLEIIGNLGGVVLGSFTLEARVSVTGVAGTDTIKILAPVTLLPYNGANSARVTIAPGDNKNFTITEKGSSCVLRALTTKGGNDVTSGLTYEWYKYSSGSWVKQTATTQTLTVQEKDVDTSALYKVIVKESGAALGEDIQKVLDASDPYDILTSIKMSADGNANSAVSTNDQTLDDEMPDAAYLEYTCIFVKRGDTSQVSGTATFAATVVAGNGAQLFNVTPSGNKIKVTVGNLRTYGGLGDFELVIDGTLTV